MSKFNFQRISWELFLDKEIPVSHLCVKKSNTWKRRVDFTHFCIPSTSFRAWQHRHSEVFVGCRDACTPIWYLKYFQLSFSLFSFQSLFLPLLLSSAKQFNKNQSIFFPSIDKLFSFTLFLSLNLNHVFDYAVSLKLWFSLKVVI